MVDDRIAGLFAELDGDCDGMVSADSVSIESLSANTLLFLQPLFKEMEEKNARLDEILFHRAMIKLI